MCVSACLLTKVPCMQKQGAENSPCYPTAVQDPVIFSGSVRANLDPFDTAGGDLHIWEALRQAGMAETIQQMEVRAAAWLMPPPRLPPGSTGADWVPLSACILCWSLETDERSGYARLQPSAAAGLAGYA